MLESADSGSESADSSWLSVNRPSGYGPYIGLRIKAIENHKKSGPHFVPTFLCWRETTATNSGKF